MANNRIHTTFDLLSANVFNQSSLQTIDLPFELVGYSTGSIDSSTGIVTDKNKYQNLEAGQRIIIKGFDNTATYKVQTEVTSVVDNQDGTIIFLVLDNFILEITEIMFYVPNDVKVKHGTIIDGNIQLTTIKDGEDKYPLIFQHEITRETFFNDKRNKLERESEVDLFFLCVADFKDWQIAEHNKFTIKPMRELALKFIEELKTSNGIGEFDTFEILDHVKFGVYTTEKGHTERIFNDNLSGVQLRMTIPFLKTCGCPGGVVNIPVTPCIPRTITRSLKNSLANYLVVLNNTSGTNSGNETASTIGAIVNGASSATPNDTDLVMSVESSIAKKNTWTQIKAFLKTYYDTIYTTTSAVAIQITTALSGYATKSYVNIRSIAKQTIDDTPLTGTTAETKQTAFLIPANTFVAGDVIELRYLARKVGTAGSGSIFFYVNTSDTLLGATNVARTITSANTQVFIKARRDLVIKSSTVTEYLPGTTNSINDYNTFTTTSAQTNINWAIDQYIIPSCKLGSKADSITLSYVNIIKS